MAEERVKRRLAAIMAADVVCYSRLMEQDEAGTLAALKARRRDVLNPLLAKHQGRIFKTTGDGVLVVFDSAVDAVQCAVDLQQGMAAANGDQPDDRQIVLRIGVNLGDVMVEGIDFYGDGVNIAARLESIADPGGILVSGAAYDFVHSKVKVEFRDMGAQALKNITEPIRAYRVVTAQPVAIAQGRQRNDKPSIAVLPLTNMGDGPEQEYLSDGIAEDIVTELSRSHDLFVIARNSSFQYRDKAIDIRRVGRELGADFVVEGSLRRQGERIRVTVQLIEAATGKHVWAERYDRELKDIFAVQDDVVATIVATLIGRVAAGDAERVRRKPPQLWAAYEFYLQGRALQLRFDWDAAVPLLRRAIELDPEFAQAYGWLAAGCYVSYSAHGRPEDLEEGLALAQKAIALDPQDSGGHRALGLIYALMRQYELAGLHYDRALSLNPNDIYASTVRNMFLAYVGRGDEAVRNFDTDLRRDPFPPTWYWECRGIALFQTRRHSEVIDCFRRMELLHWWSHCYVAAAHAHLGHIDQARQAAAEVLRLKPDFSALDLQRAEYWREQADSEHLISGLRLAGLTV